MLRNDVTACAINDVMLCINDVAYPRKRIDNLAGLCYNKAEKGGWNMSWKDDFKNGFDRVYEIVKRKYPDIRFPCYGGRFYWFLWTRRFDYQ